MYRNSDLMETHSMIEGHNQYMSGFMTHKAKSGFDKRPEADISVYYDNQIAIQEAEVEGKSGGSSSMKISDVAGLQGILEDSNECNPRVTTNSDNFAPPSAEKKHATQSNEFAAEEFEEESPDEEEINEALKIASNYSRVMN